MKVNERIETTDQRTSETSPIPSPQKPSMASPNTGELQETKDKKTKPRAMLPAEEQRNLGRVF